jgi:hypothetical protein
MAEGAVAVAQPHRLFWTALCACVCFVAATFHPFPWAIPAVGPQVGGMPDWAWPSTDNACDEWSKWTGQSTTAETHPGWDVGWAGLGWRTGRELAAQDSRSAVAECGARPSACGTARDWTPKIADSLPAAAHHGKKASMALGVARAADGRGISRGWTRGIKSGEVLCLCCALVFAVLPSQHWFR